MLAADLSVNTSQSSYQRQKNNVNVKNMAVITILERKQNTDRRCSVRGMSLTAWSMTFSASSHSHCNKYIQVCSNIAVNVAWKWLKWRSRAIHGLTWVLELKQSVELLLNCLHWNVTQMHNHLIRCHSFRVVVPEIWNMLPSHLNADFNVLLSDISYSDHKYTVSDSKWVSM